MNDKISENMESDVQKSGELNQPVQQPSPELTSQTSPVDVKVFAKALQSDKEFLDAVANQVRSVHDKRTVNHEKRISDVEGILARFNEFKAEGWSDQQAIRLMKLEDNNSDISLETLKQTSPEKVAGPAPQATNIIDPLVIDYATMKGIDPKSADFLELIKTASGKDDILQKIYNLADRRAKNDQLNPAAQMVIPTSAGSTAPSQTNVEELTSKLSELQKNPMANIDKIRELNKQLQTAVMTNK